MFAGCHLFLHLSPCVLLQNELAILEFIHCLVETLDRYFSNVCELDLMFNLEMVSAFCPAAMLAHLQEFWMHGDKLICIAGALHSR